ncbi:MAG TPA: membrane receptor RagA [Porphyromonadaceae bacterium]|nr:membrane receptor RagA [Porphyromonadaceae bacterium]
MKINMLFCFSMVENKHFNHFFRAMKICTILLFVCVFQLLATQTDAQNTVIRVNANTITIGQLLKEIEQQTDYLIVYRNREVDTNHKVRIHSKSAQVKDYLKSAFADTDIDYLFENNYIVLSKKHERNTINTVNQQNSKKITGLILDETGEPVVGANIVERGTSNGVISDVDGKFSLDVSENAVLAVSYIGYVQQFVSVSGKTSVEITLQEDTQALEEVIVVGYGIQKKVNLTGAVSQVGSQVFENRPVTSAVTALQGALPGVYITPKSGDPNADISFNVRGTTSINGGDPLVLVDGIESSMKLINPNDIESVTVLKDAAASSIYGVRAAFGVILVTTKKGNADDKLKINYSGNFSWSKATVMPEFVEDSYTHAKFVNESLARENIAALYNTTYLEAIKNYAENPTGKDYYVQDGEYFFTGYYDWVDALIRTANPKQTHNVSISGGSGKTSFYSSVGYSKQEGVLKVNPDIYERTNARLTVENNTYDWMKIGLKMVYNSSKMNEAHTYKDNIYHSVVFSSPLRSSRVWNGDPEYPEYDKYIGYSFDDQNPEILLREGGRNILKNSEIILSPSIDITPMKNWNIHLDYSYSKTINDERRHRKRVDNMMTYKFVPTEGVSSDNSYEVKQIDRNYSSFNAYTDYSFDIAEKNRFKVMVGFNQEVTKYKSATATRKSQLSQELPSLSLGTGEQTVASDGYEWALRGGFGRVNYNFDDKYLLEVNGRYDGTSRFPKDDRFVFLPSFSLGWRLSEESFMSFVKPLFNNIKLRGSYGQLGNQLLTSNVWSGNTKYYPYIPFLSNNLSANYIFGTTTDIVINPASLTPASLTWEKSTTVNGGIDLTLLASRLDMSFEVYRRTTSDMLISQEYPELLGATAPVKNSGELRTDGWELTISWRDKIGADFSYNVGFNLFDAQAKITKYDGPKSTVTGYYVGKKIGEIWGYETAGFFKSAEDVATSPSQSSISSGTWTVGDIKYRDLNGDDVINVGANTVENPGDRRVIGNTTPRYNYGISLGATYKDFYVNAFFQGVGKRDSWPSGQAFWPVATQYFNTQKWFVADSWSENDTNAYFAIPRARSTKNQQSQTKYLQDASYLRFKNLTVGYNIPKRWIEKIKLSNAQIYFSGENLCEISHMKGAYDPEQAANDGAASYPFQRTYSVGIDVTF